MITGKTKPTQGEILLNGVNIAGKESYDISNTYGIGRKFQGPNVFDEMSVYENLEVALSGHTSLWQAFTYRRTRAVDVRLEEILSQINLTEQRDMLPRFLSHGQRQWLEMGMDYGSDPTMAAQKAQELILKDGVCAIVGTNSSATRLAVIPTVEQNDSLLVYNTYYEGEKPSPNVLYTNSVPSQQIDAFVPWMMKNLGKRVFFAGTDYEFPKKSIAIAKKLVQDNGGVVVGEEYVPTTQTDFSSMINKIKEAKPDVVFSVVAGNAAVPFYKQYSQYGMQWKGIWPARRRRSVMYGRKKQCVFWVPSCRHWADR